MPDSIVLPPGGRAVLGGPDFVARRIAGRLKDAQTRWLLNRPKSVRMSFLEAVIDGEAGEERWMLLQDDDIRSSYVEDVLEHEAEPDRQAIWLLSQPRKVRESYVKNVLD